MIRTSVDPVHVLPYVGILQFVCDQFEVQYFLVDDGVGFAYVNLHLRVVDLVDNAVVHHLWHVPVRQTVTQTVS